MSESFDRPLSISIETTNGISVVSLAGELDAATNEDLQTELRRVAGGPALDVILDLTQLRFIDSTGLNALALGARGLEAQGGSLTLAGAREHIAKVFDIVQLGSQVPIEATVDDARHMLASRQATPIAGADA